MGPGPAAPAARGGRAKRRGKVQEVTQSGGAVTELPPTAPVGQPPVGQPPRLRPAPRKEGKRKEKAAPVLFGLEKNKKKAQFVEARLRRSTGLFPGSARTGAVPEYSGYSRRGKGCSAVFPRKGAKGNDAIGGVWGL